MSSESFILVKINRIVQTVVIWLRGKYESCFSGVERIIQDLQLTVKSRNASDFERKCFILEQKGSIYITGLWMMQSTWDCT